MKPPATAPALTRITAASDTGAVAGILLAGGLATRMGGGDKPLRLLGGRPVIAHLLDRLRPQTGALAISANGDPARFSEFGLPVIADTIPGHAGPLAGILAGLEWAAHLGGITHILSLPADTPFVPGDLVARLHEAAATSDRIALAASGGRTHPPIALWPLSLRDALARFLRDGKERKVAAFAMRYDPAVCRFGPVRIGGRDIDPFFNINTPMDMEEAERLLAGEME
jgi:molybdopterin-guanine dinucleotide biosynthesis protein A